MAIYRGGRLVGTGGSIATTVLTDGITLEGDGSENNQVRVKNAGINTVHLGENTVTLAKIVQGEANQVLVYDSTGALVEGQYSAPKAVWWGLDQTGRVEPQRLFYTDYQQTTLLRFKGFDPDETYYRYTRIFYEFLQKGKPILNMEDTKSLHGDFQIYKSNLAHRGETTPCKESTQETWIDPTSQFYNPLQDTPVPRVPPGAIALAGGGWIDPQKDAGWRSLNRC